VRGLRLHILAFILLLSSASVARAQQGGWLPPINLSNSWPASNYSKVAVDYNGRAHVIWSEAVRGDGSGQMDTAFYTVLRNGAWSPPVDVLAAAAGDSLSPADLTVDAFGDWSAYFRPTKG
jgi:hypothetical protein